MHTSVVETELSVLTKKQRKIARLSAVALGEVHILSFILQFLNQWSSRAVCKTIQLSLDQLTKQIVFSPNISKKVLLRVLNQCSNVHALTLDRVSVLDNEILLKISKECLHLKYLSLAYCKNFNLHSLVAKSPHLVVNIHGCWQVLSPHPVISPASVVEVHLLSLKAALNGEREGLRKVLSFFSPQQRNDFLSQLVPLVCDIFVPFVSFQSFSIRQLYFYGESVENMKVFVVTVQCKGKAYHFGWTLCKNTSGTSYRNCWLTESISPLQCL